MTIDKLKFCKCLTLDEVIDLKDAIIFAHSGLNATEERIERAKLNNEIREDVYDNMKKDYIRRHKIFRELDEKIDNTPRCSEIGLG